MIDISLLSIFIPTFFIVSITPGMCMTLAMTLGMSIGVRRTLWMMIGELLGVALVAIAAVLGVSAIIIQHPQIFDILKLIGAAYLCYIGINMWCSKGKLALNTEGSTKMNVGLKALFSQGFVTAIANPKGWAFMLSLLPPFINPNYAIGTQLSALLIIILISEFSCMLIYATTGKTLGKLLTQQNNVKLLNKISGSLMIGVAIWLALT